MKKPSASEIVVLVFREVRFRFRVVERSEEYLTGVFLGDGGERERLQALMNEFGDDDWYLDEQGYRLEDAELFARTPWAILDGAEHIPAVQRSTGPNGEATFSLTPWFRIGGEYERLWSERTREESEGA